MIKDSDFIKENGIWQMTKECVKTIELEIIRKLSSIVYINDMKLNYRYVILKEVNNIKKSIVEYAEYSPYVE